jgi:hypothetical protein
MMAAAEAESSALDVHAHAAVGALWRRRIGDPELKLGESCFRRFLLLRLLPAPLRCSPHN